MGTRLVLVVDDEAVLRQVVAALLPAVPDLVAAVVRTADDAARAVAEWRPDLVVLDPSVPGLDGVGLARRLRADPAAAGVPLVALTKLAGGALLAAGCDALVAVASDAEGLLRALRHGGGAEAAGAPRPDPRAPTGARPWPTGSPASGGGPRRRAPPWPP